MTPDLLDTFLDLIETGSLTRSAERLGVTQSTVSGRVRALEESIGARLFDRGRAGASLTQAGRRAEPHLRAMRRSLAEARRAASGPGPSSALRIGMQQDLAGRLAGWARAIRSAMPDRALYVEADFSAQMTANLLSGELDLALLFTPRPHPDLHVEPMGTIRYVMVSDPPRRLSEIVPEDYRLSDVSPAFAARHAELHPALSAAPVGSGDDASLRALIGALGGAGYVLEGSGMTPVADAPPIDQPVYAAMRVRDRVGMRRLLGLLREHL